MFKGSGLLQSFVCSAEDSEQSASAPGWPERVNEGVCTRFEVRRTGNLDQQISQWLCKTVTENARRLAGSYSLHCNYLGLLENSSAGVLCQ